MARRDECLSTPVSSADSAGRDALSVKHLEEHKPAEFLGNELPRANSKKEDRDSDESVLREMVSSAIHRERISTLEPAYSIVLVVSVAIDRARISTLEPAYYIVLVVSVAIDRARISTLEPAYSIVLVVSVAIHRARIFTLEPAYSIVLVVSVAIHRARISTLEPAYSIYFVVQLNSDRYLNTCRLLLS